MLLLKAASRQMPAESPLLRRGDFGRHPRHTGRRCTDLRERRTQWVVPSTSAPFAQTSATTICVAWVPSENACWIEPTCLKSTLSTSGHANVPPIHRTSQKGLQNCSCGTCELACVCDPLTGRHWSALGLVAPLSLADAGGRVSRCSGIESAGRRRRKSPRCLRKTFDKVV